MRRVTFSLEDADHLALKLLAIHERKAMVEVVQEAIRTYLENKEAYMLAVTKVEGR
jgi:predicted DNA-binding protein